MVNLWYKNLKFDKTYLPKGYLVLVIPGVVSIDQVHYQNPQLYRTGIMVLIPWKWKLRRLKIEKWGLVIHIIISFGFWYDTCHYNTDLRAGYRQKRYFSCILLSHFHFLVSFIWFLSFSYCTKRPHIYFWVSAPDLLQI